MAVERAAVGSAPCEFVGQSWIAATSCESDLTATPTTSTPKETPPQPVTATFVALNYGAKFVSAEEVFQWQSRKARRRRRSP